MSDNPVIDPVDAARESMTSMHLCIQQGVSDALVASYCAAAAKTFSTGALFVSQSGAFLWGNDAAQRIAADASAFCVLNGVLTCADKSRRPGFVEFLSGVTEEPQIWIYSPDEGSVFLVRAERLSLEGAAPVLSLMISPTDSTLTHLWADFGPLFGLTRSEVVIVKRVIGGDRVDAISGDLGVSVETVRTHIRRIYNKLSISSREQLFSIISPFRLS